MSKMATNKPELTNKPDKSDEYAKWWIVTKCDLFIMRHNHRFLLSPLDDE